MSAVLPTAQLLLDAAHHIAQAGPYMGVAALVGGVFAAVNSRRTQLARAALTERITVEVVPTSTFDPGEGEVVRFSHHLARVRYAAGRVPARGAAVRLRYSSAEGGLMRCYLEGHVHAAAVLGMPGFAEVEVRAARPGAGIEAVRFAVPAQRGVAR